VPTYYAAVHQAVRQHFLILNVNWKVRVCTAFSCDA